VSRLYLQSAVFNGYTILVTPTPKRVLYEKKARQRICGVLSAPGFPQADFNLGDLLGGNPAGTMKVWENYF
jgi:hypothetical protein